MKYWKHISLVTGALILGFASSIFVLSGPYISKSINFSVSEDYTQVDAQGVLELTNSQEADLRQLFILSTIDGLQGKLIMIEGLGNKNSIAFGSSKTLDIVSKNNQQIIAKDDIWTITIQKNSVTFLDKDGKTGELVSDFLGK